jgi:SAM-dependent methyltransferase
MQAVNAYLTLEVTSFLQSRGHEFVSGRLLDMGCGAQPYRPLLGEKVSEWVGVDARDVGAVGFMESIPAPDASFDTVLCTDAIHYSPAPQVAIAEMARVLAPGGHLILVARNNMADDGESRYGMTRGCVVECVERSGLSILDDGSFGQQYKCIFEQFVAQYAFALPYPPEFAAFIANLDKTRPAFSYVIARKDMPDGDKDSHDAA